MFSTPPFDETTGPDGAPRPAWAGLKAWLDSAPAGLLQRKHGEAETLPGPGGGAVRLDALPRILSAGEWATVESGCIQRARALNRFLHDIHNGQEILQAGRLPAGLVIDNPAWRPEMAGIDLPGQVYCALLAIDLARTGPDEFCVLNDCPGALPGLRTMLAARQATERLLPDLFGAMKVRPIDGLAGRLRETLDALAPPGRPDPAVVVLAPGGAGADAGDAAFLAEAAGLRPVAGRDLFVERGRLLRRTGVGPAPVDIVVRDLGDAELDPLAFDPESAVGVAGLLSVVRSGGVSLVNALGAGLAGDPAIGRFVPEFIRFYLGEEPVLASGPAPALSTCPALVDGGVAPRPVDLRVFVLSGAAVSVVPCGVTRVVSPAGATVAVKDTWVPGE